MKRLLFILLTALAVPCIYGAPARPRVSADELYRQMMGAHLEYRFADALSLLERYAEARSSEQYERDCRGGEDIVDIYRSAILLGENMIERVQKIEVTRVYRVYLDDLLQCMASLCRQGQFVDGEALSVFAPAGTNVGEYNYVLPGGVAVIWESYDDSVIPPDYHINQTWRLTDGTWDDTEPLFRYHELFPEARNAGVVSTPFMAADGSTIYFAADGAASVGGLDIFLSRRDEETGRFLQPLNLGMPFNSPADDYLMVLNEEEGRGWWATNRHALFDEYDNEIVEIFEFKISEGPRVNIPTDDPELLRYAREGTVSDVPVQVYDHREVPLAIPPYNPELMR